MIVFTTEAILARSLMSDAEWAFYELFIDAVRQPNGRRSADPRLALNGVFWIARTGAPWRDLPAEFGKWSSVYRQFRRWTMAGLWQLVLDGLNDSEAAPDEVQMVDSTIVRAHQHAAGSRKRAPQEGIGRSRGGVSTKIHLRVNGWGLPMRTDITPGQASDYTGYQLIMADNLPAPTVLIADKGYDADSIREAIEERKGQPVIPMRRNRKARKTVDMAVYTLRNLVERCFNRLKNSRRIATRYDKTAESFLGFIDIACIHLWCRRL